MRCKAAVFYSGLDLTDSIIPLNEEVPQPGQSKIKIGCLPPLYRFFSLSKEEFSTIPWINNHRQIETSFLIIPPSATPIQQQDACDSINESQLSEIEPKNEKRASPNGFAETLNQKEPLQFDYISTPVVDVSAQAAQRSLAFPYTTPHTKIKFLQINNVTSVPSDGKQFVDMFIFTDKVITETIRINSKTSFSSFQRSFDNGVIMPYPFVEKVYIIFLLYNEFPENQNIYGELVHVGFSPVELDKDIKIKWVDYKPGSTLMQHFEFPENNSIQIQVSSEHVEEITAEKVCRLTAFDSFYPSPLLTVSDIMIEHNRSLFPSKSKLVITSSIKLLNQDPNIKTHSTFITPNRNEKSNIGYSSITTSFEERITLLEPLNFYLDFAINDRISLVIEVNTYDKGKLNPVLTITLPLTKQIEEHNVKMESRGIHVKATFTRGDNIIKLTSIYPTVICPPPETKQALLISGDDVNFDDPMYKSEAPYVIQRCSKAFPFIVDEPIVDISTYSTESFLVMESDIFTEESMSKSMQLAMDYCIQGKLFWIIGDISLYLSDFLEKRRQFGLLRDVFKKITKVYGNMQSNEGVQIEFARIKFNTKINTEFNESIYAFPKGTFTDLITNFQKTYSASGLINIQPIETSRIMPATNDKTIEQEILQVETMSIDELMKLNATTFKRDVVYIAKDWNDKMVSRYIFVTESPLPGCCSYSKVKTSSNVEITREKYYIEKLNELKCNLLKLKDNYEAIIPPKKMMSQWGMFSIGISIEPFINTLNLIFNTNEESCHYYYIIEKINHGKLLDETPNEIVMLCNEIWNILINLLPTVDVLVKLNSFDETLIKQYREFKECLKK
ncbi:hypothetical protein GPJ56_000599 [Histomonas meleagridis]|uniref:uncharacterized protein n=1 Tax=Histomonas meleagridis TaxID=135588 RepID=UPI0035598DF2|nr:hypothetical protein GPJ56_000599 [Histomonas meleagridis]KAH0806381.1 hypothetical protein GO595_000828 [Histomonas meleagridis]